MDTKEVNLDYFKHQSIQLLAIIKQLSSIEDQYDAIIYILSAINAYLKNIFTYTDREILKTKIYSSPELVKGHVSDVLQALKGDDKVDQSVINFSNVNNFNQLLHFPYFIRGRSGSNSGVKILYKVSNQHVTIFRNPEEFSYKEFISWTAGINTVNKLNTPLKAKVLVRRAIIPRPIKRSVSLSAADIVKKPTLKHPGRSLSTNVRVIGDHRHSGSDTDSSDESHLLDSIDYDELILNPELEHRIAQVKAGLPKATKVRRTSKGEIINKLTVEKKEDMDLVEEKLDELEGDEDDDESLEPKATGSDPTMPAKKPAKKRKTHPCLFCKKSYRSRKTLMLHFQHHPGFCPDCGEKVGFLPQEIVEHNRQFHIKERPIICEQCGESFTRNQQYQVHLQYHDKVKEVPEEIQAKYICAECGITFNNQKGLEKHIQESEHKQDKRLCDICGVDFDTNTRLLQHVRRAHRPKSFACKFCSKEFTLKCNLDRHIKSLHSNNPCKLVCEHCGNEYSSQNSLNEHMEVAHKKSKLWKCNVCDKTFFIKRLLKVHEIVHSEYRPFQCTQCDQCYKRRSHLDRHVHFSHNKNGKVTRGESQQQQQQNGEDSVTPTGKASKKKKTPEEIAMKKKMKNQAATINSTPAYSADSNQPTYSYDMQNYANTNVDYNNCGPDGSQVQINTMHIQNDPNAMQMYNTYNDQMMKYEPSPVAGNPHQANSTNDFTNQYYLQENAVSWDNMQMYNNGAMSSTSNDNMDYSVVGVNSNDYMHVPNQGIDPSMDKHQQQLMNIPGTNLFYNQDNMWDAANQTGNQQGNTYNNIGNILTNLELIGNNSNFENSFDIVTSQGMENPQPQQTMPSAYQDPQAYHHQPHPTPMQHAYHDPNTAGAMAMQTTLPPVPQGQPPNIHHHMNQQQYHMNYAQSPEISNHTITDISNIQSQNPYKMKHDQM